MFIYCIESRNIATAEIAFISMCLWPSPHYRDADAKLFCFPLLHRHNDLKQQRQTLCGAQFCPSYPVLFQSMHSIRSEQILSHFDFELL